MASGASLLVSTAFFNLPSRLMAVKDETWAAEDHLPVAPAPSWRHHGLNMIGFSASSSARRRRRAIPVRSGSWLALLALFIQTLVPLAQGLPTLGGQARSALICKAMLGGSVAMGQQSPGKHRPDTTSCPVCTAAAFATASLSPPDTFLAPPDGTAISFAVAGAMSAPCGREVIAHGARAPPAVV